MTIRSDTRKLQHVTKLAFCRCLLRMRKCMTDEARREFLALAKKKYAELDRSDEDAVEDLEFELNL